MYGHDLLFYQTCCIQGKIWAKLFSCDKLRNIHVQIQRKWKPKFKSKLMCLVITWVATMNVFVSGSDPVGGW